MLNLMKSLTNLLSLEGANALLRGSKNQWRNHLSPAQLVFQDPYSSLNPRQRIGETGQYAPANLVAKSNAANIGFSGTVILQFL